MSPEEKKILEETYELTKKNNKILHGIRNVQKWQAFWSVLKIVIVVGVALGAAYYLEPFFNKAMDTFNQVSGIRQSTENISLEKILKNVKP